MLDAETPAEAEVSFDEESYPPLKARVGSPLYAVLGPRNSPVLFGCRTGICGTCLIEVVASDGNLVEPDAIEKESLDLYAPDNPRARLACQINVSGNMKIKKLTPL